MLVDKQKNKENIDKIKSDFDVKDELMDAYSRDIEWYINNHFDCKFEDDLDFNCEQKIKGYMDDISFENGIFYRRKAPCAHTLYRDRKEVYTSKFLISDFDPLSTKNFFYKSNTKNIELFLKDYEEVKDLLDKKKITKQEFLTKSKIVSYFNKTLKEGKGSGIYLTGGMGVGKTTLMQFMAIFAAEKYNKSIAFVSVSNLVNKVKETFNNNSNANENFISKLQNADLLFLDDIGGEPASEWMRDDLLFTILNYRMENNKLTYFTSNFSMEDLKTSYLNKIKKNYYGSPKDNEIKNDRFFERIKVLSKETPIAGTNHRN